MELNKCKLEIEIYSNFLFEKNEKKLKFLFTNIPLRAEIEIVLRVALR